MVNHRKIKENQYSYQNYSLTLTEKEICKFLEKCKGIATQKEIIYFRAKDERRTRLLIKMLAVKKIVDISYGKINNRTTAIVKLLKK